MSADELAFWLRTRTVGGTIIIELHGELDMLAHRELGPRIHALVCRGAADVVLDLRAVTFLDAGGIRLLLAVREHVAWRGGVLRLIRGTPRVSRILTLVRLDGSFTLLDALPRALAEGAAPEGGRRAVT
ncbi:STAS domain-containing protein [Streptomyces sp. NPDC001691]|uniref:STAS domain-containing protein n=1 Tax=unclassified Streptomyces TaxID=2593676 RepID=UPI00167B60B3|nr:STAS domain-containing protein [Streptomyces sp. SDr-06]